MLVKKPHTFKLLVIETNAKNFIIMPMKYPNYLRQPNCVYKVNIDF